MVEQIKYIPARLKSAVKGGHVTGSEDIDAGGGKTQQQVNNEASQGAAALTQRVADLEAAERITYDGGEAQIATGSDFTNPDASKRAKIPTVGAVLDGINDGIYDVSLRFPAGGPNSDGKFTLDYILNNANTLIPTSRRHGGMTISFVQSSDNNYVQYRYMGTATAGTPNPFLNINNWQKQGDEVYTQGDSLNLRKSEQVLGSIAPPNIMKQIGKSDIGEHLTFSDEDGNDFLKISPIEVDIESPVSQNEKLTITSNLNNKVAELTPDGLKVSKYSLLTGSKYTPKLVVVDQSGHGDYTTISAAINGSNDDATILVLAGTYNEHIDMYNKKRHLVGISKDSVFVVTHDGLRSNNPCNVNVGSIENITFIAMIDQIPSDYNERPAIERVCYAIHIDRQYTSSERHELTIRNCRCISYAHAGIGIGLRYNQTITINNCELISYKDNTGGFLMHNDDFNPDSEGGIIVIKDNIIRGTTKAVSITSLDNNAKCTLQFINNNCGVSKNGVDSITDIAPSPTNHLWGADISNSIFSSGNNINELNY